MRKLAQFFIPPMTLSSYFVETLNKRTAGQGSVFCVWLFKCNDSMSLAVRKTVSETKCHLSTTLERSTYFFNVNVAAKNHIFNIFLIWIRII